MGIQGLRHTSNFVANERPENWRQGLLLLYPNSAEAAKAPLLALSSLMKSRSVDDPVFHWWEKELDDRRLQLAANLTTSNTEITVDATFKSSLSLKEGDVVMVESTGELMHVAQNPVNPTTIQVTRGVGSGGVGTVLNISAAGANPYLLVVGSAFEEGSMAPVGINFDPTERWNYTQIFRSTLEMTRTASKTRLRTTDQVKEAKRECLEYISIDMERAFWFGKRSASTKNGKPLRTTAGVRDQIVSLAPSNVWSPSAAIDMDTLEEKLAGLFTYGSSEKVAFAGNLALATINSIVRKNSSYTIQNNLKEYGIAVTRLTSPFGELVFKAHPLFTQSGGGVTDNVAFHGFSASMAILDMSNIEYVHLTGDDLRYEPDLTANGLDGQKSGYIAECGLELHHAKTHHWWNNISASAKDSDE